jgi:hypothetical protein
VALNTINQTKSSIVCDERWLLVLDSSGIILKLSTLVVIDNDCRGSCKPNYHNDHDHDGPLQLDTKKIVTFVF